MLDDRDLNQHGIHSHRQPFGYSLFFMSNKPFVFVWFSHINLNPERRFLLFYSMNCYTLSWSTDADNLQMCTSTPDDRHDSFVTRCGTIWFTSGAKLFSSASGRQIKPTEKLDWGKIYGTRKRLAQNAAVDVAIRTLTESLVPKHLPNRQWRQ